jgi:pre-mRNA-splicing helicase BRR2
MTNKKCNLPKGSTKLQKKGYDEVYVPAVRHKPVTEDVLISIKDLPEWTHKAFPSEMKSLNTIQSRIYEAAFKSPENLLVCAPTGAGKTNIALLTILQCLNSKRRAKTGKIDIRSFKIVYIAPMKALVSEIVGNF